jgi:hypothetical protein
MRLAYIERPSAILRCGVNGASEKGREEFKRLRPDTHPCCAIALGELDPPECCSSQFEAVNVVLQTEIMAIVLVEGGDGLAEDDSTGMPPHPSLPSCILSSSVGLLRTALRSWPAWSSQTSYLAVFVSAPPTLSGGKGIRRALWYPRGKCSTCVM